MSLVRYWDGSAWAYGESVFDGRVLPHSEADERFWSQREAVLGTGRRAIGEYLTPEDMRNANVEGRHYNSVWRRRLKSKVECACGDLLWQSDAKKGCKRCRSCREQGRSIRKPRTTEAI